MSKHFAAQSVSPDPYVWDFRHRNRIAERCHWCGTLSGNATLEKHPQTLERIRVCRRKNCRAKLERPR